jgi:ABC-type antimicrobial peptide transport system permease subunit
LPTLSEIALSVSWEAMALAAVLALLAGATAALAPASEAAKLSPALAIAQRAGASRGSRQVLTCLQVAFGVIVLVVLTSYYALMESDEKAEARRSLGQDTVTATVDPIAAMREPVDQRYIDACNDALAEAFGSPAAIARLRQQTPLLSEVTVSAELTLSLSRGGRVTKESVFLTSNPFGDDPGAAASSGRGALEAFGAGEPVAVINPQTGDEYFGSQDPVGQSLTIGGRRFTVVAVRPNSPGSSGTFLWVPIAQYKSLRVRAERRQSLFGGPHVEGRPTDLRRYAEALAQLRNALLPMLPEEYRKGIVFSEQIPATTKQFIFQTKAVAVRGAVGALAVLLVALIGLANMLLVSVHDEVRETGVRRAFGATRPDVFLHFLRQGVLLSALGAIAGLAIGAAFCAATRSWAGLPLSVSVFWAGAGAVATVLAGTLTSVAPALLASRIHPVEALRYE